MNITGLGVLNLNGPEYTILNWLVILLENRKIASKPLAENEIYVIDIIRNNWKNGQVHLDANISPSSLALNLYFKTHSTGISPIEFWRNQLIVLESNSEGIYDIIE